MQRLAAVREDIRQTEDWRGVVTTCLMRWHLCSLDAPTVAVVWAIILTRLGGSHLHWDEGLVLGLGAWIVYVLDRLLDGAAVLESGHRIGMEAAVGSHLSSSFKERHHFHWRHRRLLLPLCGVGAFVLALLCCRIPTRLFEYYLVLAAPVIAYALCVHWPLLLRLQRQASTLRSASLSRGSRSKEIAVALLFTAAVAGPAWVDGKHGNRAPILAAVMLLAWLCGLNCALISHAEGSVSEGASRRSESARLAGWGVALACATVSAMVVVQRGRAYGAGGAVAAPGLYAATTAEPAMLPVLFSIALSSLLMLALLLIPCSVRRLRVLADLGLLTPVLFLFSQAG